MVFPSLDQYNRAHAALNAEGLVRRKRDSGGGLGGLGIGYAGLSPQGTIWIDAERRDDAAAALAHVDLELLEPSLPIVDRAEPICPECATPLPADGPAGGMLAERGVLMRKQVSCRTRNSRKATLPTPFRRLRS